MGSKYSQSNNEEIKEKKKIFKSYKKKNYKCETEDIYINLAKENTDNSSITTATDIVDVSQPGQDLVPFTFEWKGDCSKVTLAGTFLNNWTTYITMPKNKKTGVFQRKLFLPRTKHEFKFIIGNNWVCSDQYPTVPNQYKGFNNFIDLTNYILTEKKEENKEENNTKIEVEEKDINNNGKKPKKTYNCRFPPNNELNTTAPNIIHHYRPKFDIDYQSRQNLFKYYKDKNYLKYDEKNYNTENNTFKKIMIWPHEKLMHACPNLENLNQDNNTYYKVCTTLRTKHKYITIVYYKPK